MNKKTMNALFIAMIVIVLIVGISEVLREPTTILTWLLTP